MEHNEISFEVPVLIKSALSSKTLSEACKTAVISKISNGIYFLYPERAVPAPTTLLPSPVPKSLFYKLKSLQTDFNDLYHKVAMDSEFLRESLGHVVATDPFCGKLMQIMEKREQKERECGLHKCHLGIFRADYMFEECDQKEENGVQGSRREGSDDNNEEKWKARQIEVNTIASSFLALSPCVASLHKSVLGHIASAHLNSSGSHDEEQNSSQSHKQTICVPKSNKSLISIANGMIKAHNYYSEHISPEQFSLEVTNGQTCTTVERSVKKCIVFVVSGDEKNRIDQLKLKDQITNTSGILVYLKTFAQLRNEEECYIDEQNRFLIEQGKAEVSVFYFRTGYAPDLYESQQDWDLRERMDLSLAISCPAVRYQLAGMKKIQQVLAQPSFVEKYIEDCSIVEGVRSTFAQFMSLDSDDTAQNQLAIDTALQNPSKYVLKPQREGGGNNYFDQDMIEQLTTLRHSEDIKAFILMERVYPLTLPNVITCCNYDQKDDTNWTTVVSELGIYGVILSDVDGHVIVNEECGHLLRSKDISKLDGGVVAGNACLDSPYLV